MRWRPTLPKLEGLRAAKPRIPRVFPQRKFQDRLVEHLRKQAPEHVALTQDLLQGLASSAGFKAQWPRDEAKISTAIRELIKQRIIVPSRDWALGKELGWNEETIVGDLAEDRLSRLPPLSEVPPGMVMSGRLLLVIAGVLFFIFYCTYLPQAWIGPVTGTTTFIAALLGYAGLKLADTQAVSASRWTWPKWFLVFAIVCALTGLNWIGRSYPCIVEAPPGATITVDGTDILTTPDIASTAPHDWLTNWDQPLHLRWDSHEIRVSKKWHFTGDWQTQSVGKVHITWSLENIFHPAKLFEKWGFESALTPQLQVQEGVVAPEEQLPGSLSTGASPNVVADSSQPISFVKAWNTALQAALNKTSTAQVPLPIAPSILRVQVRDRAGKSGTIAFGCYNLKGEMSHILRPILVRDLTNEDELEAARADLFAQLEKEIKVRELKPPAKVANALAGAQSIDQANQTGSNASNPAAPVDAKAIGKRVAAAQSGISKLTDYVRHSDAIPPPGVDLVDSVQKSSEVAQQVASAGETDSAVRLVRGIAELGTAAAESGNTIVAKTAQDKIKEINAAQPDVSGPTQASQSLLADAIEADKLRPPKVVVFLHIGSEAQRDKAQKLQRQLQADGYLVPAIENVLGRASVPEATEVRHFDEALSEDATRILNCIHYADSTAHFAPMTRSPEDAKRSLNASAVFEVWFGMESLASNLSADR